MGMMYVPAELVREVELLKELRRKEKCYDIICYDSKEETENEERSFPHTPYKKEEKEKEEREEEKEEEKKKNLKKIFSIYPSFDEVRNYCEELDMTEFEAHEFYDYYESFGWKAKDGRMVQDWRALLRGWQRNHTRKNNINKQNNNHNESYKKNTHTNAHGGQDADARARDLHAWLDVHYPLPLEPAAPTAGPAEAAVLPATALAEAAATPTSSTLSTPSTSSSSPTLPTSPTLPSENPSVTKEAPSPLGRAGGRAITFCRAYAVDRIGLFRSASVLRKVVTDGTPTLGQVAGCIGTQPVVRLTILHLESLASDVNTSPLALSPYKLESMATTLLQEYHDLTMPELLLAMNRLRSGLYGDFLGRLTKPRLMKAMKEFMVWRNENRGTL